MARGFVFPLETNHENVSISIHPNPGFPYIPLPPTLSTPSHISKKSHLFHKSHQSLQYNYRILVPFFTWVFASLDWGSMGIDKIANVDMKCRYELKKGRKKRQRKGSNSKVQILYDVCKEVFADCGPGVVPDKPGIERLKLVLDNLTADDVGDMPFFKKKESEDVPKIAYLHICDNDKFSIVIFCLPPSGVIPLHNHPGMTVFSKLLFGTMHIKSYDWVDDGPRKTSPNASSSNGNVVHPGEVRLAKVKVDSDFTSPCNTSILYPADGGNMHCFTAVTACAVLDVLGPPYCDPEGRHCAYYLERPLSDFSVEGTSVAEEEKEGYAWLEERDKPEGLSFVGAPYTGPKIGAK